MNPEHRTDEQERGKEQEKEQEKEEEREKEIFVRIDTTNFSLFEFVILDACTSAYGDRITIPRHKQQFNDRFGGVTRHPLFWDQTCTTLNTFHPVQDEMAARIITTMFDKLISSGADDADDTTDENNKNDNSSNQPASPPPNQPNQPNQPMSLAHALRFALAQEAETHRDRPELWCSFVLVGCNLNTGGRARMDRGRPSPRGGKRKTTTRSGPFRLSMRQLPRSSDSRDPLQVRTTICARLAIGQGSTRITPSERSNTSNGGVDWWNQNFRRFF